PDPDNDVATGWLQKNQVVLNWYPKIQAMKSLGVAGGDDEAAPNQAHLRAQHVACLDLDRLFFDLERYKAERGWHNLNLPRSGIAKLLADTTWYRLLIPESELAFDAFEKVHVWQEIASSLLRKYVERYYTFRKREWELPHLEYRDLDEEDPNFPCIVREDGPEYGYQILIEESREEIVEKLNELKAAIVAGDLRPFEFRGLKAIWFARHLYQPLMFLEGGVVEVSPAPLNKGERRFVEDLKAFCDANPGYFEDRELYLLRNLSRGRGVGFFEAGNFHPDFIIWQVTESQQHVTFVDPKGTRNVDLEDPKIGFYQTVKEIEERLKDPAVVLESFIVSNTPAHVMRKQWGIAKDEMLKRHIVFQEEDKDTYIGDVLRPGVP
ncbi:MAG: DEAD/DEAH box helicase, partial [Deltaproteobacteria bacterium]